MEYGNTVQIVGASSPALMAPSPGEPSHSYLAAAARESVSSFTKLAGRMNFSLTNDVNETNTNANQRRSRSGTASSALMATETAYDPVAQRMADPANADSNDNNDPEITPAQRPRAASYISITGTGSDRRISYNHTRDTSYDEYVREQKDKKRASQHISQVSVTSVTSTSTSTSSSSSSAGQSSNTPSTTTVPASSCVASESTASSASASASAAAYRLSLNLNLKNEVDDALSAQFGWGTTSRSSSMDSEMASGQPPAIAVSGGAVKQPKYVRDSLTRAPSDGSEQGFLFENTTTSLSSSSSSSSSSSADSPSPLEEVGSDVAAAAAAARTTEENRNETSKALFGVATSQQESYDDTNNNDNNNTTRLQHPELLRPGRPKSEAIAFVVTPPPKSPKLDTASSRMTWGSAYART